MSAKEILFFAFAIGTVVSALGVVLGRNPVGAAMSMVAAFFFLAGLYVLLLAHTIAVVQVLVYAGAIMVLFLFVIMLLSLSDTELPSGRATLSRILGGVAAVGLFVLLGIAVLKSSPAGVHLTGAALAHFGTLETLGGILYSVYLLPFEAVSLLLLVAIVGAVVVSKSRV